MASYEFYTTTTFNRNWISEKRIVINRGGTRSGKTFSICQQIALWLMTGQIRDGQIIEKGTASIVRKNKTTVTATVQRDFEYILKEYGYYQHVTHNKTNRTYSFDGRMVEMFGADDEQKLRGYKSDILYVNEANELNYHKEFLQLRLRTKELIIIDFNPSDPYTWIKTELEDKRAHIKGDVETIVSTYKDNSTLTDQQIAEIEYLKETDPTLWQVYGLGEYGKVEGLIIPDIEIIEEMPWSDLRKVAAGMDFGFTNSKTALAHCGIIEPNNMYIDVPIYESGLTDTLLTEKLQNMNWDKTIEVFADSAQPASIKTLQNARYNVRPVKKFKDSIDIGIAKMREYKWHVTARSEGLIREQKLYKFKQAATGEWINKPITENDHAMDAVRYYVLSKLLLSKQQRGRKLKVI
jgi:phage terminase large subunit